MSRVRFATARALFETFPKAYDHITTEPTDAPALDFMKMLASSGKYEEALSFCAYLLPRREAVWWACRSVRTLAGELAGKSVDGLVAAEAWAEAPDEELRRAAHAIAVEGDADDPMMWLALATAWSGGTLAPQAPEPQPTPPHLTAVAARVALLLTLRKLDPAAKAARAKICLENGARLAETGL